MANLQLELDRNATQVNIVVAQAGCLSVCSSLVRSVCPSFAGGSLSQACPRVDSSSDTTRLGTGVSLAGGSGDIFDFAEVFLFGMTGLSKVEEIMIFGVIIWPTVICQPLNCAHSWEVVTLPQSHRLESYQHRIESWRHRGHSQLHRGESQRCRLESQWIRR